jgi:hypothetical protein
METSVASVGRGSSTHTMTVMGAVPLDPPSSEPTLYRVVLLGRDCSLVADDEIALDYRPLAPAFECHLKTVAERTHMTGRDGGSSCLPGDRFIGLQPLDAGADAAPPTVTTSKGGANAAAPCTSALAPGPFG